MDPFRSIVVPTDFSPLAEAAAARAAVLARRDGAELHLVHALAAPVLIDPYGYSVPADLWAGLREAAQSRLEQARKAVEARGVPKVTTHAYEYPDPVVSIAEAIRAHRGDLVVMGTHGRRGIQRAFLGSVAERALRTLDTPVLAVREDVETAAQPIAKIALAVDFSPHSDRAVEMAEALAARLSASIDLVHVLYVPLDYDPFPGVLPASRDELERVMTAQASERLEKIRERLAQRGIRVQVHLDRGHPDAAIVGLARRAGSQLIVMGTRGRTGLAHVLLGSVAERTLRGSPCSVLCVRAPMAEP
jgi:nucleotide-binding universal stress UspA family protein